MKVSAFHSNYNTPGKTTSNALKNNNHQNKLKKDNSAFHAELSFKGKKYPSGYYEDDEIEIAKKYLRQIGEDWKKTFKKDNRTKFADLYWDSPGLNHITSAVARPLTDDWQEAKLASRVVFDISTVGIWEAVNSPFSAIEASIKRSSENKKLSAKAERIAQLMLDMHAEEEAKAKQNALKEVEIRAQKIADENRFLKLKNEIKNGFIKLIDDEKMGKKVEVPNVIMIEDRIGNFGDELMDYTRKNANTHYKFVPAKANLDMQKELYESLKNSKAQFDLTGMRSLIEVEHMSKMLTPETAAFSLTEWMKDIMTSCTEEFKSTIVFKTKDSSKIISEALEPHRIGLKIINLLKR